MGRFLRQSVYCVVAVARIIVIGPPASGKGSISRMICKTLGTEHITMDSLMKDSDSTPDAEAEEHSSTLAAEAEEHSSSEAQEHSSSGSAIPVDPFANLVHSRQVYQFFLYTFMQLRVEYLWKNLIYNFLAVIFVMPYVGHHPWKLMKAMILVKWISADLLYRVGQKNCTRLSLQ